MVYLEVMRQDMDDVPLQKACSRKSGHTAVSVFLSEASLLCLLLLPGGFGRSICGISCNDFGKREYRLLFPVLLILLWPLQYTIQQLELIVDLLFWLHDSKAGGQPVVRFL
jgi:hypothetical protein